MYTIRSRARRALMFVAVATAAWLAPDALLAQQPLADVEHERRPLDVPARLSPTAHPPIPSRVSQYWLVPEAALSRGAAPSAVQMTLDNIVRGIGLVQQGSYAPGLDALTASLATSTPLSPYARYYAAFARLRMNQLDLAAAELESLAALRPDGFLSEAVALRRAETALARNNPQEARTILDDLARQPSTNPADVLLRAARAAEAAGDPDGALAAYRRVYFEHPLSLEGEVARLELARFSRPSDLADPDLGAKELMRAEQLFAAKRFSDAREAYERLRDRQGAEQALVVLRLAECAFFTKRFAVARDGLKPFLFDGPRVAEARYYYLATMRGLGLIGDFVERAHALVKEFPQDSWAEETLNLLGTHYVVTDQDDLADDTFTQLLERFPQSRYGERAAWKVGWRAFRANRYDVAIRTFERAAASFPRADLRPAWLYWAGRANERVGDKVAAQERFRLAIADYQNSYYGRLAQRRLGTEGEPMRRVEADPALSFLSPTESVVRQLIAVELFDDATREIEYAKRAWGDSPALQATLAWIRHRQGFKTTSRERFDNLRGAIGMMKRAYPQYLAAGGEQLPPGILEVVFPLDYWPLIRKHADAKGLDPFLLAALVAQESTFTADIRSSANAVGLMQLIPSTGRRYAKKVGVPYSSKVLTTPDTNVHLGTTYLKELIDRFGGAYFALASYNAGEGRVAKWIAQKPGIPEDEFIDDIPFPETQNYVKKILGTAEDYRRLYAPDGPGTPGPRSGALENASTAAAPRAVSAPPKGGRKNTPSAPARGKSPRARRR